MTVTAGAPAAVVERDSDATALDVLRRHGEHTSAFLAYNQDTRHFTVPHVDGLIAYRTAGRRHLMQLCGPFAEGGDRPRLLAAFREAARAERRRVTAVQLRRDDAAMYADSGFVVNQVGSSYGIDLERFTLRGTKFFKLRNKLKRAARLGVTVEELTQADLDDPATERSLAGIDTDWLRAKGRLAKELTFMIGERGGRGKPYRRVFLARHEGHPTAYVTYSPCFGERPGWLYDLTRRHPDSPPGTIEAVFNTALEALRDEGCRWLHLGLTPLVGLDRANELAGAHSRVVGTFVSQLGERGAAIYPAAAQEKFKLKWGPHVLEPEYVAFDGRPSVAAVWQLLRLTRAI